MRLMSISEAKKQSLQEKNILERKLESIKDFLIENPNNASAIRKVSIMSENVSYLEAQITHFTEIENILPRGANTWQ